MFGFDRADKSVCVSDLVHDLVPVDKHKLDFVGHRLPIFYNVRRVSRDKDFFGLSAQSERCDKESDQNSVHSEASVIAYGNTPTGKSPQECAYGKILAQTGVPQQLGLG